MEQCIFCKIRDGIIAKEFVYQDKEVMVFADIHPKKPIHWLIVPKQHIPEFTFLQDMELAGKLFSVIQKMVQQADLKEKGYRIEINGGGLQDIDHLHIHLFGPMGKMR